MILDTRLRAVGLIIFMILAIWYTMEVAERDAMSRGERGQATARTITVLQLCQVAEASKWKVNSVSKVSVIAAIGGVPRR